MQRVEVDVRIAYRKEKVIEMVAAIPERWCCCWIKTCFFVSFLLLQDNLITSLYKKYWPCYFLLTLICDDFFGGDHLSRFVSTMSRGLLNCADRMCSSTSLGVTQITCWPFQYFTMFMDCSVEIISVCVIAVRSLKQVFLHYFTMDTFMFFFVEVKLTKAKDLVLLSVFLKLNFVLAYSTFQV